MKIELASVGTSLRPLELRFEAEEVDLDDQATIVGGAVLQGETFRDGTRVHLRGTITTELEIACVRCLEPVRESFDIAFDDVFLDSSEETTSDETELGVEDLDEALVIGGSIDLAEVVREQIILALPDMPLCRDDCKGLCDKCGTNRNLIDCSCARDEIDPRWAALQNLN